MKKSELKKMIQEEINLLVHNKQLTTEHNYKPGEIIKFKDGEEWVVAKRGSTEHDNSNKVYVKPFNKLAKSNNVSLAIDLSIDYINKNKVQ